MLLGWVHRVRDLGSLVFIDLRDRHGITQVVARDDDAARWPTPSGCARSSSSRSSGTVELRAPESVNPKIADRRDRGRGARDPAAERREDAAVPDRGRVRRRRRHAAEVSLPRSAARRACSTTSIAAPPRDDGDPEVLRRAGLPRDRDADADEVDAGRGARLPRAEPRAPGRVLRAAAVAADLQADPDDRRAWTATSRSSSASATRICAPIASRSSRRSTSRSRSRPRTSCSRPSSR